MDTIDSIRTRRSVRQFLDCAVPHDLIEALAHDASCAPYTPPSRDDPFVFCIVEGVERIALLGKAALLHAREHRPQAAGYEWTEREGFSVFHGAPVVIVLAGREAGIMSTEECIRAAQLLTLSAHARGLGCCWVGSPILWLRSSGGRAAFRIPDDYVAREVFVVGYADGAPPVPIPRAAPQLIWV
jgi:nitroreductase